MTTIDTVTDDLAALDLQAPTHTTFLQAEKRMSRIIENAVAAVKRTLGCLADEELSGDPKKGVTEMTFKMLLIQAMLNDVDWEPPSGTAYTDDVGEAISHYTFEIKSEKKLSTRSRADIVVLAQTPEGTYVHIIETKYIRTGFLLRAPYQKNRTANNRGWRRAADAIRVMTSAQNLNECYRYNYGGAWHEESVGTCIRNAETRQCARYIDDCQKTMGDQAGYVSSQVICGLSTSVVVGDIIMPA